MILKILELIIIALVLFLFAPMFVHGIVEVVMILTGRKSIWESYDDFVDRNS